MALISETVINTAKIQEWTLSEILERPGVYVPTHIALSSTTIIVINPNFVIEIYPSGAVHLFNAGPFWSGHKFIESRSTVNLTFKNA